MHRVKIVEGGRKIVKRREKELESADVPKKTREREEGYACIENCNQLCKFVRGDQIQECDVLSGLIRDSQYEYNCSYDKISKRV